MQGSASEGIQTTTTECAFCLRDESANRDIVRYTLKETPTFRIVTDHAPLVEGHLLIIPKTHYACYGAAPAELDAELQALKQEARRFLDQFYANVIFWEHGVFGQTVFHAHLHCFPFGEISYDPSTELHEIVVTSQDDIRSWYQTRGHYFYLEDTRRALLFAPERDSYLRIIQEVLRSGVVARNGHAQWRPPQQRYAEREPLIASVIANWQTFQKQQQGVQYAD
jgi:diadenosine tetraphosphate (Ap4A) HIT family hydrolase